MTLTPTWSLLLSLDPAPGVMCMYGCSEDEGRQDHPRGLTEPQLEPLFRVKLAAAAPTLLPEHCGAAVRVTWTPHPR